ncbi:MAG: hypothetical protein ABL974_10070 [Prosthecobacter sp.]
MKVYWFIALIACLLVGCSSSKSSKRQDVSGQPMSKRIANSMKRMNDPNDRSQFDKSMQATFGKKKGSASWFSRQKYGARDYNGVKSFGTSPFKTGEFAEGDNKSAMGRQNFAERDKTPAYGDDSFRTGTSPFADKSMRDGTKSFSGADDIFKTRPDSRISKSAAKDNMPKFIELDDKGRGSAYSEDEVRRLLGRD